ncbi:Os06g0509600 [Oryza sativa Japonica Group]|uniref:Exopolygalacturonase n=1 Tax=Oryza sativa subsp. japonica TaxID=39947 RepID=A0A0P0WXI3_ORYSJ|nr:Os06g0509600 [Oryza sativa Japonica Group]
MVSRKLICNEEIVRNMGRNILFQKKYERVWYLVYVKAFLAAWRAACGSAAGNATLLIPEGTFAVSTVEFSGPCKNGRSPLAVVVDGVLHPCAGGCHRKSGDDDVWITFSGVSNLLVTGAGTLDGRGGEHGHSNGGGKLTTTTTNTHIWRTFVQTLELDSVANATVRGLRFLNSRGFHLNLHRSSHVAAERLRIEAPAASRNTDGIHVGLSSHVTVADSLVGTGDDCVSIGPGSSGVVIAGVACGPGHGISVGSLGREEGEGDVRGLVVRNCTVVGTTNGLRIKTWPGSPPSRAFNITFRDIVMSNVSNPIIIDQHYCPHAHCSDIAKPSLVQISDVTYERIEGTSSSRVAVQLLCSEDRPCSGVRFDRVNLSCGRERCGSKFSNVEGTKPTLVAADEAAAFGPGAVPPPDQDADVVESQH